MQVQTENFPSRVLLGVCGGIAAYKSPDLVRRLIERGAEVRVVMTRAALEFVSPVTFQAVSGQRVHTTLWDSESEAAMGHIELARWAELVLIAPATAQCIGTLAHGLAPDLLGTLCLATEAPIVIAPAMNRSMWASPAVQSNCETLAARGVMQLGPGRGSQACGEEGYGRMLEPLEILAELERIFATSKASPLGGVKIVITAGPTREPIDPVRYITNRSSGKMGFAVAAAARAAGAEVVLVSGPVSLPSPAGVTRLDVETAQEMFDVVHEQIRDAGVFVACAAVSDYRPESAAQTKIKRLEPTLKMQLVRSPDTLASVAALPDGPFTVGFAAETNDVTQNARSKLERKGLDMIAANRVGPDCGFDKETNQLTVLWPGGETTLAECAKPVLAARLIDLIAERYLATRAASESTER